MIRVLVTLLLLFCSKLGISQRENLDDKRKFEEYVIPVRDSASKAFNLWTVACKGGWKGVNTDSLFSVYQILAKRSKAKQFDYIRQHPDSYVALEDFERLTLHRRTIDLDTIISVFSSFSQNLRSTSKGKSIEASIVKKKSLSLDSIMPDFSFKSNDGESHYLSSFQDKNVLLCFWASWCGPCIRNIPLLKRLEITYRSHGLRVISISIDDSVSNWFVALKKYSMPWLQTCDSPAYVNENLRKLYDINYVPTYFLIDKQRKLVYQSILENDDDEYTGLREALQKTLISQ